MFSSFGISRMEIPQLEFHFSIRMYREHFSTHDAQERVLRKKKRRIRAVIFVLFCQKARHPRIPANT